MNEVLSPSAERRGDERFTTNFVVVFHLPFEQLHVISHERNSLRRSHDGYMYVIRLRHELSLVVPYVTMAACDADCKSNDIPN